ncbi:MAG: hypothetical protein KKB34_05115 [Bacteroidetes bacterium]|nr:hypothetical protein [Bacteroidota bacterium]
MGVFGSSFPALWDPTKEQAAEVEEVVTSVVNVSSQLHFKNAHDFEVGMMLYIDLILDNGVVVSPYKGWAYIISKTELTVTLDRYINGDGYPLKNEFVYGYIGIERALYEETDFAEPDSVEHKSVLTGKITTITKGYYSAFIVRGNLLNMSSVNRTNLTRLLNKYNGKNLTFYPHSRESGSLRDANNNEVVFNINTVFKYISSIDFRDYCIIRLKSQAYTDLSKSL